MTTRASEPSWSVEFTSPFARDLNRLPEKVASAVIEFVLGPLAQNPHRLSRPLSAELTGMRSARRGNYRVLVRIDESARVVYLINVDHRSRVYRSR